MALLILFCEISKQKEKTLFTIKRTWQKAFQNFEEKQLNSFKTNNQESWFDQDNLREEHQKLSDIRPLKICSSKKKDQL